MIVLGLNGGTSLQYENVPFFGTGENHDAAAALLIDGEIVGAIEEERLNRIKHTNKFPSLSIQYLLDANKLTLAEVDYFAIYATEEYMEKLIKQLYWADSTVEDLLSPRAYIANLFEKSYHQEIDQSKICFVDHHMAHAASCYYLSGFDESLILTIDGVGCDISGRILYGRGTEMTGVDTISQSNSLGFFYAKVIEFAGYRDYDEYKVMGLAPYGDPKTYRDIFSLFYKLLAEGKYEIYLDRIGLLYTIGTPRRKGQEFSKLYQDVAAALQESLETIVMHVLSHYSKSSGLSKLCLAGGVAHNCSANGKVFYSDLFDEIFVQPASHDAGNSIGSALFTYIQKSADKQVSKLDHVLIGTPLETNAEIESLLQTWQDHVSFEYTEDPENSAAELLADGKIIGWVQGQSEFGPRALGNRSIVADPRPSENKDIINMMVKKREAYRPFAPSVLSEYAEEYFDIGDRKTCLDYMTFVVNVKEHHREHLGAITHVDGTARIQTVPKDHHPRYWKLIDGFRKRTGVPILLNTSFNNNVEPIVNSVYDSLVCFLTTGLDYLVAGNYVVSKTDHSDDEVFSAMIPNLHYHTVLNSSRIYQSFESSHQNFEIGYNYASKYNSAISEQAFRLLSKANGSKTIDELTPAGITATQRMQLLAEIKHLWGLRFIGLNPGGTTENSMVSAEKILAVNGAD